MARLKDVPIRPGDSLQSLAQRELGDGLRWRELVSLNNLRPPYLIATLLAAERLPYTLIWGDWIKVPSLAINDGAALGEDALGQDVRLTGGDLAVTATGDLDLIAGHANFAQALRHRVVTPFGTYLPHPSYGCEVHALLGIGNGPAVTLLGAGLVRRAMLRDPRSGRIAVTGQAQGDQLRLDVQATPVGSDVNTDFNLVYPLPVI